MKSACSQLLLFLIVLIILISSSFSSEVGGNNINPDGRKKRSPPPPPSPSPPPPPPLPTPDYYLLVLQWPYSFCRNTITDYCKERKKPTSIPLHLTIHGFWPQMSGGSDPELIGQKKRPFVPNEIPKEAELQMYWPDLKEKANSASLGHSFLISKWRKHGSLCNMEQKTYFQTAVDEAKPIIKYWDAELNMKPNSMIDLTVLRQKFEGSDYKAPRFVCNEQRVDGEIKEQLHEIRFVWTTAGFHANVEKSTCKKNSVWLPGYVCEQLNQQCNDC